MIFINLRSFSDVRNQGESVYKCLPTPLASIWGGGTGSSQMSGLLETQEEKSETWPFQWNCRYNITELVQLHQHRDRFSLTCNHSKYLMRSDFQGLNSRVTVISYLTLLLLWDMCFNYPISHRKLGARSWNKLFKDTEISMGELALDHNESCSKPRSQPGDLVS